MMKGKSDGAGIRDPRDGGAAGWRDAGRHAVRALLRDAGQRFGPYDQRKDTWGAIMGWVHSEGLTPNGAPWEVYVDDSTTVEPSKLRTEIYVPVL